MLALAAIAIDQKRRGVFLPFEIGRDLPDGTDVEYTAIALDPAGKVVSRASGRGRARNGRAVGDVKLAVESKTSQVRFAARVLIPEITGTAFATVKVPDEKSKEPACGGFVLDQAAARTGIRDLAQSSPVTISTLVSAQGLDGTVAPLSFGLGPAGGVSQRRWPVQLAIPLANGLWRVAFTLRAPVPAGSLEVRLLREDLLLADNCLAQFATR